MMSLTQASSSVAKDRLEVAANIQVPDDFDDVQTTDEFDDDLSDDVSDSFHTRELFS